MSNIKDAFQIESLSLNDNVLITEGQLDPSTGTGYEAPIGSLYINSAVGDMYHKVGPLDTDWLKYGNTQTINFQDIFAASKAPTGHINRVDSAISFNDTTRTFSIAPVGVNFVYYIKGTVHTITAAKTLVLPNTTGLYVIYFDGAETLQHTNEITETVLTESCITAVVYWNATQAKAVYFADERHGTAMSSGAHYYLHEVIGAKYHDGLTIGGTFNPGSETNADIQLSITNGMFRDEDLEHHIAHSGTQTNVYDLQQTLTPVAQIPVFYRLGAAGDWYVKTADNYPLIYNGTAGYTGTYPPYNNWNGSAWVLTSTPNTNYMLVHIVATNDPRHPVIALQGLQAYQNRPAGRDAALAELNLLVNMPFQEFMPIASLIVECKATANAINAKFVTTAEGQDYVDWRYTSEFGNVVVQGVSDHGNLTGLDHDDHAQYALAGAGSTRTFNLGDLLNVTDITPTNGTDYGLKWNAGSNAYDVSVLNLTSLQDVAITESPAIDGWTLAYQASTGDWIATPVGDQIPLTTKGDLLTNTGSVDIRLAVGLNGQILSADSTTASGLKWIANTDELVKVSATDTAGYLDSKFANSTNISTSATATAVSFDLTDTGVTAGAYNKVTVDAKGRVVVGSNPTTLAGHGITDAYTIAQVDSHTWDWATAITSKPTTVSGYSITDVYTMTQVDALTWDWTTDITSKPTTIAGYGITDAYTKAQVDAKTWDWNTAIYNKPTTLSGYGITDGVNVSQLGVANGVATLDATGKLPVNQLPALAITDTFVVASQIAMLALNAQVGDIAIRTDLSRSYVLQNSDPTVLANWVEILQPASAGGGVTSVAATAPAAGFTITGSPITTTGTFVFALANDLAAVENLATTGIAVRTAADTWATRTITGTANQITVTNGSGTAGNPTLTIASNPIIPGTASITMPAGTTAQRPATPTVGMMRYNSTTGLLEMYQGGAWVSVGTNTTNATVSSVAVTGSTGLTVSGSPITTAGTIGLTLGTELQGLSQLGVNGLVTRTSAGTYASRSITSSTLAISNADGAAGHPAINLSAIGTAGTFQSVTVDAYGRVTAGSQQDLDSLSDVTITTPVTGEVPYYNGTEWVNNLPKNFISLNDLLGITVSNPQVGESLYYNGTQWINYGVPGGANGGGAAKRIWSNNIASSSGTTVITPTTTPPSITAGTQLWSMTVNAPYSTLASYVIQTSVTGAGTTNQFVTIALFRTVGGVSTYIGGTLQIVQSSNNSATLSFSITDKPNTLQPVTYSVRVGITTGTWYVNRRNSENTFGGTQTGWVMWEY